MTAAPFRFSLRAERRADSSSAESESRVSFSEMIGIGSMKRASSRNSRKKCGSPWPLWAPDSTPTFFAPSQTRHVGTRAIRRARGPQNREVARARQRGAAAGTIRGGTSRDGEKPSRQNLRNSAEIFAATPPSAMLPLAVLGCRYVHCAWMQVRPYSQYPGRDRALGVEISDSRPGRNETRRISTPPGVRRSRSPPQLAALASVVNSASASLPWGLSL